MPGRRRGLLARRGAGVPAPARGRAGLRRPRGDGARRGRPERRGRGGARGAARDPSRHPSREAAPEGPQNLDGPSSALLKRVNPHAPA